MQYAAEKHHHHIDISLLPERMQELIDLIGLTDTYTLVCKLGGQDVYIPKYPDRSKLIGLLPRDSVATLSEIYGGTYLALPTSRQIDNQERNQTIIKALKNGESRASVARRFGISVRQVANIRRDCADTEMAHEAEILPDGISTVQKSY